MVSVSATGDGGRIYNYRTDPIGRNGRWELAPTADNAHRTDARLVPAPLSLTTRSIENKKDGDEEITTTPTFNSGKVTFTPP